MSSWDVSAEGLTIVDGSNHRIVKVGLQKKPDFEKTLPVKLVRCSRLNGNQFIITTSYPAKGYSIYDERDFSLKEIQFPLPDHPFPEMTLDGFFVRGKKQLFFVCYMTGYFFSLDTLANFKYGTKTVDQSAPPEILDNGQGTTRYHPLAPQINGSAVCIDNILYIHSLVKGLEGDFDVIDLYSADNGGYLRSLKIVPYKGRRLFGIFKGRNDSSLLAIHGEHIVEYSLL